MNEVNKIINAKAEKLQSEMGPANPTNPGSPLNPTSPANPESPANKGERKKEDLSLKS